MLTRDEHLRRAKETVESTIVWSGPSWRMATEHMVAAKALHASQRQIAREVGMSPAWVHAMLKWGARGYKGTPFGPSSKSSRQRTKAGQAADQKDPADQSGAGTDQAQAAAARARARTAKAEAAKAKADAAKATAEERRARAEAFRAQAEAARAEAEARTARARSNSREWRKIHSSTRDLLVKALGMLGSNQAGERDNAALMAEKLRAKLGIPWDELIIPAENVQAARAA